MYVMMELQNCWNVCETIRIWLSGVNPSQKRPYVTLQNFRFVKETMTLQWMEAFGYLKILIGTFAKSKLMLVKLTGTIIK